MVLINMNTFYLKELMKNCIEKNPVIYSKLGQSCSKLPFKLVDKKTFNILEVKENFENLKHLAYTYTQLQAMAKYFHLSSMGTKYVLACKIYFYLYFSFLAKRLQKWYRGIIVRKFICFFGNALLNRKSCTNVTDFITLEDLTEIKFPQFFSYKDKDGFIYGFDFVSIYCLLFPIQQQQQNEKKKNPYNRQPFPTFVKERILKIIKLSKLLNITVSTSYPPMPNIIVETSNNNNPTELLQENMVNCFQRIQSFENMHNVSVEWFSTLAVAELQSFAQKLYNIWIERAEIPLIVKRRICFPNGQPFRISTLNLIISSANYIFVKRLVVDIIDKFINTGIDDEHCALGAFYVVGVLTLVSPDAAAAFPWLFESFNIYI